VGHNIEPANQRSERGPKMQRAKRSSQGHSPLALALVGTLAIHLLMFVGADAVDVLTRQRRPEVAPQFESFEIVMPPPPVAPAKIDEPPAKVAPAATAMIKPTKVAAPTAKTLTQARPNSVQADPTLPKNSDAGGTPVYAMSDLGPAAKGVAVQTGPASLGPAGRGGSGGGNGIGTGDGSGQAPIALSVAAIKKPAMPKGDYAYFDDYPDEAKQLGISGQIKVRLLVSAQGNVVKRTLLIGLGHGLDELAMKKAATMEFSPARDANDVAVASVVVWTFTMQVR
jgi:TonB family protein